MRSCRVHIVSHLALRAERSVDLVAAPDTREALATRIKYGHGALCQLECPVEGRLGEFSNKLFVESPLVVGVCTYPIGAFP